MIKFFKSLESEERQRPSLFWLGISFLSLIYFSLCSSFAIQSESTIQFSPSRQVIVSSADRINPGGNQYASKESSFLERSSLNKGKKFNLQFHHKLEQKFPDWDERISYQMKQEQFYKSAMKKSNELKRLKVKINTDVYTKNELDAIDYFNGTGFYKKHQDLKTKPNIFDTRQSFLFKMHDPVLRRNFLNSFNRLILKND